MSIENKITFENTSGLTPTSQPVQLVKKGNAGQRFFSNAHAFIYRLFGGRLGGQFRKSPVLLLTTVGRKSGQERTLPLLYLKDGENLILVASNGGAQTHPAWWLNLQAQPEAEVQIGRQKFRVTAAQATPEEKKRLWPLVVAMYPDYANYQKRTEREIPVVI